MDCEKEELEDLIRDAVEEKLADLSEESEDRFEELEEALENTVEAAVENAVQNLMSRFELVTADGTHLLPRRQMSLTNPDRTKVLLCYGGLRVEERVNQPLPWALFVQTRVDSWEPIYAYATKEEAVVALEKVKKAILDGADALQL